MKRLILLIISGITFSFFIYSQTDQLNVWFTGVSQNRINVRGNPVTVGQITINAPTTGKVLVHFDGMCIPSDGDRIILAASNNPDWEENDGSVFVSDKRGSFSHTRIYDVTKGEHTFYAVAQNSVEEGGTGIAFIYGSLSIEFFPDGNNSFINLSGINQDSINVRGNPVTVGQITISAPTAGKVLVRFDGMCVPSDGDRIILAASNNPGWEENDGSVFVKDTSGSFSHTRMYDVAEGEHTFYAVAQNSVDEDGTGIASIYGSLSIEFYPDENNSFINLSGIDKTSIDLRSHGVEILGRLTIDAITSGKVWVHFDGMCIPSYGDRIVLSASNEIKTGVNDGNVAVSDESGSFSHTRMYDITEGENKFYAVGVNSIEKNGTGIASIYGSLSTKFYPNINNSVVNHQDENFVSIYPNPTDGLLFIELENFNETKVEVINLTGQLLQSFKMQSSSIQLNIKNFTNGIYLIKVINPQGIILRKIIKQ